MRIVSLINGGGGAFLQRLYRSSPIYTPMVAIRVDGTTYSLQLTRRNRTSVAVPLQRQFSTGTWYDVQIVYDWSGTQPVARAYVNGVLDTTITDATAGTVLPPDTVYVGVSEDSWTEQIEVNWDEVSVANGV
jgi:hypothetical protein